MSKSETPRTDVIHELRKDRENLSQYFYMVDHARQLERELAAAREEIEAIMETLKSPIEVELDMIRGKIAIPDRAELDCIAQIKAITDQRDGLRSGIDYASDQLHKVTEQRDRLAEALTEIARGEPNWAGCVVLAREVIQSLNQTEPESKDPHRFCRGGGGNNFHCGCKYDG
jgi:chromosome segregation ATPase